MQIPMLSSKLQNRQALMDHVLGIGGDPHIGDGLHRDLPLWKEVAFAPLVQHYTWRQP